MLSLRTLLLKEHFKSSKSGRKTVSRFTKYPIFLTHTKKLKMRVLIFLFTGLVILYTSHLTAQSFPVEIINTTGLPNDSVYVAVVGEDLTGPPGNFVWVDLLTGLQKQMSISDNTIDGPIYGGNMGPGGNAKYANCFTRLSEINNLTFSLHQIQGCRIFLSLRKQLYFYFFNQINTRGYAGPNLANPTDPNLGIPYEIVELTYNNYGFFGNTTRVDAYQRPIGIELIGNDGAYRERIGEMARHQNIIQRFSETSPAEFQVCLNLQESIITQPSKIVDFLTGGTQENYFKPYIDAIWEKYSTVDLTFNSGAKGIWSGRVNNQDMLILECIDCPTAFLNRKARIARRPTTQEAFEGKGVLNLPVQDTEMDLAMQAQICAAINRHVIDISTPNPGVQDWSNPSNYYQEAPANFYAKFWHEQGISFDNLSYGFAYDDVWEQSSSLHTPTPSKLIIHFGNQESCNAIQNSSSIDGVDPNKHISSAVYGAFIDIESSGIIPTGNTVTFKAGESILLKPNFYAQSGSAFLAQIENCDLTGSPIAKNRFATPTLIDGSKENKKKSLRPTSFKVFPNPMSNQAQIQFQLPQEAVVSILLYDQTGKMVKELLGSQKCLAGHYSLVVENENLPDGLYHLILQTPRERITKKVMIINR